MQLQSRSHINMNNNNTQTQVTLCGESQKWFLTLPSSGGRTAHHKQISPSGLHTHTAQLCYSLHCWKRANLWEEKLQNKSHCRGKESVIMNHEECMDKTWNMTKLQKILTDLRICTVPDTVSCAVSTAQPCLAQTLSCCQGNCFSGPEEKILPHS